jgi:hypothetical protein
MIHISPWEATLGLIKGSPPYSLRRRRSISTVLTYARGSQRRQAIKPSTGAFAIATRTGVCETSKWSPRRRILLDSRLRLSPKCRRVPARLIVSRCSDRPPNGHFRNSHRARGSSLSVSRLRGNDERMPEERGEKSNHNNAKDKTPRVGPEGFVVGGQPVGIAHAKLLGRPPASQAHQRLIKIS